MTTPQTLGSDWRARAKCGGTDDEIWFVQDRESGDPCDERGNVTYAKSICARCPVIEACRTDIFRAEHGLPVQRRFGIFAGLTASERARLDPHRSANPGRGEECPWPGEARGVRRHASVSEEPCAPCARNIRNAEARAATDQQILELAERGLSVGEISRCVVVNYRVVERVLGAARKAS